MSRAKHLLFVLVAIVAFTSEARASKPVLPKSYSFVPKDERFVFVMLAPADGPSDDGSAGAALRRKFPSSGLYRNDGSRDPLWTIDWYAHRVHLASDGIHLVRVGYTVAEEHVVGFYASGDLLRTHSASELCGFPEIFQQLWAVMSDVPAMWFRDDEFDDATLRYSVLAQGNATLTFDATTGHIISSWRPWWLVTRTLVLLPAVLLVWFVYRRFRRRAAARSAEPKALDSPGSQFSTG